MPYERNADLPESLHVLPERAKTVWRKVFNENADKGEDSARKIAWTAIKNGWEKNEDTGKWHLKTDAAAFAGGCVHCGWGIVEIRSMTDRCVFCGDGGTDIDDYDDIGDLDDGPDEPLLAAHGYQTRGGKKFHRSEFFYAQTSDHSTWK